MKKKNLLLIPLMLIFLAGSAYCDETKESEKDSIEFPQWALYVRRAEIITFGSMPFTTMGVTMIYGAYQYFSGATSSFPNPFNKSSSSFSDDDIKAIIGISFSVSLVIGIVDMIITIVKHNNEAKRLERLDTSSIITIVPATEEEIENFKKLQSQGETEETEETESPAESENDVESSPEQDTGE